MPKVFLSHSSEDDAFARKLAQMLEQNGIDVWVDEAKLRVGDSLFDRIGDAIDEADFIAVILSHNSVHSEWVRLELNAAMQKQLADGKTKILPILIEPCEIPLFLRNLLYADFTDQESFDAQFTRLLDALGVEKPKNTATEQAAHLVGADIEEPSEISELEGFEDISVIGVDKGRIYKPYTSKDLYNIYFELSNHPPQEWVEVFDAERRFPRHTMWRKAWIEGKYIVVYCVPNEVREYHLRDIKQDVETCNQRYRLYLQGEAIRQTKQAQREAEEERALDKALDNLGFS